MLKRMHQVHLDFALLVPYFGLFTYGLLMSRKTILYGDSHLRVYSWPFNSFTAKLGQGALPIHTLWGDFISPGFRCNPWLKP